MVAQIRNNKIIQIYEEEDPLEIFEAELLIILYTWMIFDGDLWIYQNFTDLDFDQERWGSLNIDTTVLEISNMGKIYEIFHLGRA